MKKFIAIAIAVLTVFSFTTVAFAESTTTLTTTVPDAEYTLNIPADQEIEYNATRTNIGLVTVTNSAGFADGKNLCVTVTYDAFKNNENETTIPFILNKIIPEPNGFSIVDSALNSGTTISFWGQNDGQVLEKPSIRGASEESRYKYAYIEDFELIIDSMAWGKALGGDYTATITFTAEVVAE